jgi:phosphoribosyl 1,2-cyclic phosphodiesterase
MTFTPLASSSKGNCYLVSDGASSLLLEAGLSVRLIRERLNFGLSAVAGCLVSHAHLDHAKGAADLLRAGIDVYVSAETAQALNLSGHRLHVITPLKQFSIGPWKVVAFPTIHDAPGSLGFLVQSAAGRKLLFVTDTAYIKYRFQGVNVLAIECNYQKEIVDSNVANGSLSPVVRSRLRRNHFSLENVLKFMAANDMSQVKEIYLMHLSDGNSNAEHIKTEIQRATGKLVNVCEV